MRPNASGHPQEPKLALDLPMEGGAAAAARRRLGELAVEGDVLHRLSLLVTELITNAVRHSEAPAGSAVGLQVRTTPTTVRAEVTDGGRRFGWRRRDGAMLRPGGLGLVLVDRLADRWGIAGAESTRVWVEVGRRPGATGPRASH